MYIIEVNEDGENMQYEYGSKAHAEEHYNFEAHCTMYEYIDGKHYYMKSK
jgi:hypothetical protein